MDAAFCPFCGHKLQKQEERISSQKHDSDFDLFMQLLQEVVRQEQDGAKLGLYQEKLFNSGFASKIQQAADYISSQKSDYSEEALRRYQKEYFLKLIDQFIIRHCGGFNKVHLSQNILKYQMAEKKGDVQLFDLIFDYLAFELESIPVFTDFLKMPEKKLKNAAASFLKSSGQERIFFIADLTLLANFKDGFAMTEKAIYWKNTLKKARAIRYDDLLSTELKEGWLEINGQFFNAGASLNVKMKKLLTLLISLK